MVVLPPKRVKIGPKTIDCIFIGYAHNSTVYQFLIHELKILDIHKNIIMESRNASFFEDVSPCKSREEPSSSKRVLEAINENSQDQDGEVEPRCSKRVRKKKIFWYRLSDMFLKGNLGLLRRQ